MHAQRVALLGFALLATTCGRRDDARIPLPPSALADLGPIDRTPPLNARFARDGEELKQWLADPAGPQEIWLHPTVYATSLEITRPVAIRGVRGAVIEGPGTGTVVRLFADDSILENVVVRGTGKRHVTEDAAIRARGRNVQIRHIAAEDVLFGVYFEACSACVLEDSSIHGFDLQQALRGDGIKLWEAHDSIVRRNRVKRVRDAVVWHSRRVHFEGNEISDARYGTHFMYTHDSVAKSNRYYGDIVGVFVMYSSRVEVRGNVFAGARGGAGMGIGFKEADRVSVVDNSIVGNTAGVYLDTSPRSPAEPVEFLGNVIAANGLAVRLHGSQTGVAFHDNEFRENGIPIEVDGGGDALGLDVRGNYWSEYVGYDLDGDGSGDVPFQYEQLSSELTQRFPMVQMLRGTVALDLVDAVARALPILPSHVLLRDPAPRMRPRGAQQP